MNKALPIAMLGLASMHTHAQPDYSIKYDDKPNPQTPTCLMLYKGEFSSGFKIPEFTGPDSPPVLTDKQHGYCQASAVVNRRTYVKPEGPYTGFYLYCPVEKFIPKTIGDILCEHHAQTTASAKMLHDQMDAATERIQALEAQLKAVEVRLKEQ